MASYRKRGQRWHAEVRLRGVTRYHSARTKAEVVQWAQDLEQRIRSGASTTDARRTVRDVLDRYAAEVSPRKRNGKWEQTRLAWMQGQPWASLRLIDLTPEHFAKWRDARLDAVTGATIRRDMTLLSHALKVAVKEWRWLAANPVTDVRRPPDNPPRDRKAEPGEIEAIMQSGGYSIGTPPATVTARVAAAFAFAAATGMRGGEVCRLGRENVGPLSVHVEAGKTASSRRNVPLFPRARLIIADVLACGLDPVFGLRDDQKDALYRKISKRAGISDLHFHDSRATFCTWAATVAKIDPLTLARILGHKDLAQLMAYYRESAESIAQRINDEALIGPRTGQGWDRKHADQA